MIPTGEALARVFELLTPTPPETVAIGDAAGRVLAAPVRARMTQPPFRTSVMDGYAIGAAEAGPGDSFRVIGSAAAGHDFAGSIGPGESVRIFTGAPVPEGGKRVVIQEDVTRTGETITLGEDPDPGPYIREAGADFTEGDEIAPARRLGPADLALIAAMNVAEVTVARRPEVALIATGDELIQPGETPGPGQIVASNVFGLAALVTRAGGHPRRLPIARDSETALVQAFELAGDADLIVTIGGASVGDHDLVGTVAEKLGFERSFYRIAMRPGKPLMAGRMGDAALLGLPGNPVSAMVCGMLFLVPAIEAMQGLPARPAPRRPAVLAAPIGRNGPREHYMRGRREGDGVVAFDRQDSALLGLLAAADVLVVRPPHDPPRAAGETVEVIDL